MVLLSPIDSLSGRSSKHSPTDLSGTYRSKGSGFGSVGLSSQLHFEESGADCQFRPHGGLLVWKPLPLALKQTAMRPWSNSVPVASVWEAADGEMGNEGPGPSTGVLHKRLSFSQSPDSTSNFKNSQIQNLNKGSLAGIRS